MHLFVFSDSFFFFNDTATTEIYTLSLHDALPIYPFRAPVPRSACPADKVRWREHSRAHVRRHRRSVEQTWRPSLHGDRIRARSEEHTSELQSPDHLVCRLLLEKKKNREILCNTHI